MKQIAGALIAIIGCVVNVNAQVPMEKTLLWEVTGKGITKPSYLFGTIHLMCPNELKMPEIVKEKFSTAKQLFLELDLDDPDLMKEMVLGMQMNDSSTIEGLMGSKFDSVNTIFQSKTGFSLKMM